MSSLEHVLLPRCHDAQFNPLLTASLPLHSLATRTPSSNQECSATCSSCDPPPQLLKLLSPRPSRWCPGTFQFYIAGLRFASSIQNAALNLQPNRICIINIMAPRKKTAAACIILRCFRLPRSHLTPPDLRLGLYPELSTRKFFKIATPFILLIFSCNHLAPWISTSCSLRRRPSHQCAFSIPFVSFLYNQPFV